MRPAAALVESTCGSGMEPRPLRPSALSGVQQQRRHGARIRVAPAAPAAIVETPPPVHGAAARSCAPAKSAAAAVAATRVAEPRLSRVRLLHLRMVGTPLLPVAVAAAAQHGCVAVQSLVSADHARAAAAAAPACGPAEERRRGASVAGWLHGKISEQRSHRAERMSQSVTTS